jgi:hypothetical protein
MTPQIKAVWPSVQPPSKVGQQRWNVAYEFCEVLARITVRAADEAEARTKAAHQLRQLGLRGPSPTRAHRSLTLARLGSSRA